MESPYRSDRTPLQERREALRRELDQSDQRLGELAREGERRQEIQRELRAVETQLRNADKRRVLPQLRDVHVAAPCPADWDAMVGDDATRFCGSCAKNVYNLSAMTTGEAEAFLRATFGVDVCVRFYRRADGTLLTADCPVGATRRRRKKLAVAVAAVGTTAAAALHFTSGSPLHATAVVMGERAQVAQAIDQAPMEQGQWVAGGMSATLDPEPPTKASHGGKPKKEPKCPPGDPLCTE